MYYGPLSYFRLGRVWPRERLREEWRQRQLGQPLWILEAPLEAGDLLAGDVTLRPRLDGETKINNQVRAIGTVQPRLLHIGEENEVRWMCLTTASDGDHVADAVVTMTLVDDEGNVVSGASGLPLTYDTDTPSDYVGRCRRRSR